MTGWRQPINAHDSITRGLNGAPAFARGQHVGANVDHVEGPAVDVAAIRARTVPSQGAFARSIGLAKGTLFNWERGRHRPTDPAQVLLAMVDKKPQSVAELLRQSRLKPSKKLKKIFFSP
jgi:putative transcriptional regulator